jgi:type I restriction enzyme M protein
MAHAMGPLSEQVVFVGGCAAGLLISQPLFSDARATEDVDAIAEQPEGRWRAYTYEDIVARDKASLDIFWLKDDSLADSDNLPAPAVIAQEIVEDLQAALEQFRLIAGDLGADVAEEV